MERGLTAKVWRDELPSIYGPSADEPWI